MITAGTFMGSAVAQAAVTALKAVTSWASKFAKHQKADSLVRFTKAARVEPITLVDQKVAHLSYIGDVMQSLTSLFSGYYLQAIAMAVNIGNVHVLRLLDSLNPTRDVMDASATQIADYVNKGSKVDMLALESYRFGLPSPGKPTPGLGIEAWPYDNEEKQIKIFSAGAVKGGGVDHPHPIGPKDATLNDIAGQSGDDAVLTAGHAIKNGYNQAGKQLKVPGDDLPDGSKIGFGKDTIKSIGEAVNLSVGKMLEVNVNDGTHSATFPISVRLIATIVGSNILAHILGDGSRNTTAKERFHMWRAGQLEFWRDLVLCQDLIDQHKKTLAKDDSGTYQEILDRRRNNQIAAGATGVPSVSTASNLVVLSASTAKQLEREIGGKLSDFNTREKVFKSTYIMILVVIDEEWEQVTFYTRDIKLPTRLAVKELKTSNKGSGQDVGEILKAYQLGQNPTI